jgi:SWI/SNF-related matrix-associated actin-dependent regulator 1 of chromatin subfamily A
MASVKRTTETLDILKSYQGENPYILTLKRDVCINGREISDFICVYVLRNHQIKPKHIDKIIRIADWYGESRQKELEIDFTPKKLKIITYLGDTPTSYHCFVQYRKSVEPAMWFIPKKAVLTNFLVEDYSKIEVDFDRYDRLSNFQRILFDHQKEAVKFLLSRKKCILADTMGLGKTTAISVAAIEGNFDSVLVVCPASLKGNWKRELSFYIPEKDITIIDRFDDKTKAELEEFLGYAPGKSNMKRDELLAEAKARGQWKFNRFVIINYDILDKFFVAKRTYTQKQFDEMLEQSPLLQFIHNRKSLVIIDEAHELSSSKSIRYKTIRGLIRKGNPNSIYLATGTPITNNPANFFCVLNLIENEITGDWEYYMKHYCGAIELFKDKAERDRWTRVYLDEHKKKSWYDLNSEEKQDLNKFLREHCEYNIIPKDPMNLDELSERVSHIYLRREKDILTLPNKTVHEIYYELSKEQRQEYEKLWEKYEAEKKNEEPEKELNKNLLEGAIYRQYLSREMVPHTIKLAEEIIGRGEKVVIACCYDEELYTLQEYFGDKCVIYNGKMSLKEKDNAIAKFMTDDSIMVFIGNIDASSVGITLISSHNLIFNDFSYVEVQNSQMSDRVHRIGQKKDVDIYYKLFRDTQYERMWEITLRKKIIAETVIRKEDDKKYS